MSEHRPLPLGRLGVVGGGQLARMIVPAAARLGFEVTVLDPTQASPGGQLAHQQIVGDLHDPGALRALVESCDLTTFEIESIDAGTLATLAAEGHCVQPAPATLACIQDKLKQKQRFLDAGIPTSPFAALDAPSARALADFGLPVVQKARRGGYDGRGVAVFTDAVVEDRVLPAPSLMERFVAFRSELAVLVARSTTGEVSTWPVVEMVFDESANVLDLLLAPARVDADIADRAREIAIDAVKALDGVGVFGVELFLTHTNEILVNEVAPRPHNSGHWTIEACRTCQFEQHVRAVAGLPLGSTEQHSAAVMVNLLGAPDAAGAPCVLGLESALAVPGMSLHLYGKHSASPFRKMGHLTITASTLDEALAKAEQARAELRIGGSEGA